VSNGSENTPERSWLQPGDLVRLTGASWERFGLLGQTAFVVEIDLDGDALIEDPSGGVLAIYARPPEIDYSAERVDEDR
jgi:hypothetical protein